MGGDNAPRPEVKGVCWPRGNTGVRAFLLVGRAHVHSPPSWRSTPRPPADDELCGKSEVIT